MSEFLTTIGRKDEPTRSATIISVTNGRAKVELSTGAVIPSALLVGATFAGAQVRVAYQDGQYVVYGSGGAGIPSVSVGGSTSGGSSIVGGTPSPHDLLGSHHTLPTGAAGLFVATPSASSGVVSMRAITLADIQGAADARYALQSTTVTAGAGLTGNGSLGAAITLAVGAGDGIAVDADVVRVRRATTSGLSFSSGGLQIDDTIAGNGLTIASKVLAVGAGNGINVASTSVAVDTGYAFTWSATHTFSARPTFSLGATIAAGQTLRIGSGTGDVDLSRKTSDVLALGSGDAMESTSYQSGVSGWRIGAAGNAEFGNVRIRGELASTVFRFNEVSATAGTLGVYYSASTVDADFTTPAATNSTVNAQIKNSTPTSTTAIFQSGDRLQVRVWNGTSLATAWFTVDAAPTTSTGYSTYSLRLQSGSTSALIPAGTAIVDWGTASGGGAVALSSDGTIGTAPNISVLTTAGSPWSDQTLRARLGNLNGSYGYAADTFGFAAGNSATTFLAVDSTNGFRVVRDTTTRFQVDTAGALTIRNTAGAAVITMDSTSARIDNVLNIGTSGEVRQGTGTWSSTFTGTRMWNDSGVGRIAGYNSGTIQWYANTDGTLKAGGGDVTLDSDGVSLVSWVSSRGSIGSVNGYRFSASSTTFCGMYAQTSASLYTTVSLLNYGDTNPAIAIEAKDGSTLSGSNSSVTITASGPSYSANMRLDQDVVNIYGKGVRITSGIDTTAASAGTLYTSGSATFGGAVSGTSGTFTGGLNVGSATGAGANEIKATTGTFSGNVSAVAGAFSGAVSGTTGTFSSTITGTGTFQSQLVIGAVNNAGSVSFNRGSTGATTAWIGFATATDAANFEFRQNGGGAYYTWALNNNTAVVEVMRLTNAGRLGVGTNAPGYLLDVAGDVNSTGAYRVSGTQVVGARKTGWAAATGTATRTTFAVSTVTTAQLAERVKALVDDLISHGLIGA